MNKRFFAVARSMQDAFVFVCRCSLNPGCVCFCRCSLIPGCVCSFAAEMSCSEEGIEGSHDVWTSRARSDRVHGGDSHRKMILFHIVRDVTEKFRHFVLDFDTEMKEAGESSDMEKTWIARRKHHRCWR